MSRKYYRHSKQSSGILGLILLLGLLSYNWIKSNFNTIKLVLIIFSFIGLILLIVMLIYKLKKIKNTDNIVNEEMENPQNEIVVDPDKYISKQLMTEAEKCFYSALTEIVPKDFVIQPQINLATIIKKESTIPFHNELFRNIDFGIFKKINYELLLLIELNDYSHNNYKRKQRDKKVKEICEKANIPLITFWLNMPNTKEYISNRITPYLKVDSLNIK